MCSQCFIDFSINPSGCRQRVHARPVQVRGPLRLRPGPNPAAVPNRHDGPREEIAEDQCSAGTLFSVVVRLKCMVICEVFL